jgi:RNA 3'-terminal phosphate cyclase
MQVKVKKIINYIKSLSWGKEDVKKILMFIIMLLIACIILNKFLRIKVRGSVDSDISGSVDIGNAVQAYQLP